MKKFLIMAAFVAAFTISASAQIASSTGAREAANLQKHVNLFIGAEKKVQTMAVTEQNTLITSGKGVLLGVEINNMTEGGVLIYPRRIDLWDAASVSGVTLASTSLGNTDRIIAPQYIGALIGPSQVQTLGGAFTSMTMANTRNNQYAQPVKFTKGCVLTTPGCTNGSVTVYWLK